MAISTYRGLAQIGEDLQKQGFTANVEFLDHAFTDVEGERTYPTDQPDIVAHRRFAGMSDPDNMSVLYAIKGNDGTRGIIVDAFGAYADPELGDFLEHVRYRQHGFYRLSENFLYRYLDSSFIRDVG